MHESTTNRSRWVTIRSLKSHLGAISVGPGAGAYSSDSADRFRNYGVADGLPSRLVTALAEDSARAALDRNTRRPSRPQQWASPKAFVSCSARRNHSSGYFGGSPGTLWFGTDRGLWRSERGLVDLLTPVMTSHRRISESSSRALREIDGSAAMEGSLGSMTDTSII